MSPSWQSAARASSVSLMPTASISSSWATTRARAGGAGRASPDAGRVPSEEESLESLEQAAEPSTSTMTNRRRSERIAAIVSAPRRGSVLAGGVGGLAGALADVDDLAGEEEV